MKFISKLYLDVQYRNILGLTLHKWAMFGWGLWLSGNFFDYIFCTQSEEYRLEIQGGLSCVSCRF